MSRRYTYARTIITPEGTETFTAVEFDSFDEAKRHVDKGVHDRKLEIGPSLSVIGGAIAPKPSIANQDTDVTNQDEGKPTNPSPSLNINNSNEARTNNQTK